MMASGSYARRSSLVEIKVVPHTMVTSRAKVCPRRRERLCMAFEVLSSGLVGARGVAAQKILDVGDRVGADDVLDGAGVFIGLLRVHPHHLGQ